MGTPRGTPYFTNKTSLMTSHRNTVFDFECPPVALRQLSAEPSRGETSDVTKKENFAYCVIMYIRTTPFRSQSG